MNISALQTANETIARLTAERDEAVALLQRAAGIHNPNSGAWTKDETARSWEAWYQDFLAYRSRLCGKVSR